MWAARYGSVFFMAVWLFLPQSKLDEWLHLGKVELSAQGLLLKEEGMDCALEGACYFNAMLEGEDALGWLSKVKTEHQLKVVGAELWGDSVLHGDSAYQVVPGFLLFPEVGPGRSLRGDGMEAIG